MHRMIKGSSESFRGTKTQLLENSHAPMKEFLLNMKSVQDVKVPQVSGFTCFFCRAQLQVGNIFNLLISLCAGLDVNWASAAGCWQALFFLILGISDLQI